MDALERCLLAARGSLAAFDKARVLCREAEDAKAKIVAAVVTLARTDRAIAATEDQWDVDREYFQYPIRKTEQDDPCRPSN